MPLVLKVVLGRLMFMIPLLFGVLFIAFSLVNLLPLDQAQILAGDKSTPEAVAALRRQLHLDQPLWERFGRYIWDLLHGDLGHSPTSGRGVWQQISRAMPVTISLAFMAIVFAMVIGIGAGTVAALRRDLLTDRVVTGAAALLQAVPQFVVGLALVIFLAVDRSWFPAVGYTKLGESPWEWFHHLVLPAFTLALPLSAELARFTRSSMIDTLEQDYVLAARAKGMSELSVVGKHVAKNAAVPIVTIIGLQVGSILGGAVLVELIYGMPGFGTLALFAVRTRDPVLIQGVVLVGAVPVLLANLTADISYGYLNPRSRA